MKEEVRLPKCMVCYATGNIKVRKGKYMELETCPNCKGEGRVKPKTT